MVGLDFQLSQTGVIVPRIRSLVFAAAFAVLAVSSARAAAPGKAAGTVTIDGATTTLAFAVESSKENLFDSKKNDTIVTLTDRPLGDTAAGDDVELSMRARRGDIVAVMLRIDGGKLVNVSLTYKGLSGVVKLPGAWFQYAATANSAGTLKLAKHEFDGHTYACDVEFTAAAAGPQTSTDAPAPAPVSRAALTTPALPPATTSNIAPKEMTALFVQAMMNKDEHQALELIKLGLDPNSRDTSGTPVLNWSVMVCMPAVVKALVEKKASLTYERAPGMTIMTEAGACPEAAKILKAAGAR